MSIKSRIGLRGDAVFHLSCLFALTLLSMSYTFFLESGFTLDDPFHLVKNAHHVQAAKSFWGSFELYLKPTWPGNLYRPFVGQSFALTEFLFGAEARAFHLGNIFIHGLVCLSVYFFLSSILERRLAFLSSLIFCLHPIHVEAIAGISNRTELLAALGGIGACALRKRPVYAAAAFFLALLSKESACCFLLLIPAIQYALGENYKKLLPYLLVAVLGYLSLRYQALGGYLLKPEKVFFVVNPLVDLHPLERAASGIIFLGKYFLLCVIPWPLTPDYSYPMLRSIVTLDPAQILYCLVGLSGLVLGLYVQRTRLWCIWFLLAFVVTANIFHPIGTVFAERLAYVPSLGVCVVLAMLLEYVQRKWNTSLSSPAIVVVYSFLFFLQTGFWKSNEILFTRAYNVSPRSAKANQNYALVHLNEGRLDEAALYFHQALKLYPNYADVAYRLSLVYREKGLPKGVEHWLRKALEIDPDHAPAKKALKALEDYR